MAQVHSWLLKLLAMKLVKVSCLSGTLLHVKLEEDDSVAIFRKKLSDVWPHPVLSRCISVLADGERLPEGCAVLDFGTEFSAVVSQQSRPDFKAHSEAVNCLPDQLEIVFVGDGRHTRQPGVGKTTLILRCRECLASTFCGWSGGAMGQGHGRINEDGTVRFDDCEYVCDNGMGPTQLISIRDSAAHQGDLRSSSYSKTSVFLLVFSLASRESFQRVRRKWAHELPPDIPFVLIGTKSDLDDGTGLAVPFQEGQAMAHEIGAADYMECSALSGAGVDDVLDVATCAILADASTEKGRARLAFQASQANACSIA